MVREAEKDFFINLNKYNLDHKGEKPFSSVSIVDFEQTNISWVVTKDEIEGEISLFDTSIPQFHNGIPTKIFKDNREMF